MIARVLPGRRRLDLVVLGCALASRRSASSSSPRRRRARRFEGLAAGRRSGSPSASALMVARDPLRLPHAAEVLLRDLLRDASLPLVYLLFFGERIANVRSWIRVGQLPVPAGRAREDRDGAARRLPLRERGRRAPAPVDDRQARRDRRHAGPARLPAARHGPRADVPAARSSSASSSAACRRGAGSRSSSWSSLLAGGGWFLLKDYQKAADRDVPESRQRRARLGLPGAAVEDRRRLGRVLGQGLPQRHAEPAALPAGPAHGLHPGGHRRGVGIPRRDPRARRSSPRCSCAR